MKATPPRRAIGGITRRVTLLAQRYAVAIGGLAYGLTLGMRRSRHRALVAQIARHFGFRGTVAGRLPVVELDAVTRPATPIVLPVAMGADGNISPLELIALSRLVAERQPMHLLEIGTFNGRTTVALAANAPAAARVVTLDLPPDARSSLPIEARDAGFINKPRSGALFADLPWASKIEQVYGDSASHDFGGLRVDFAFIDGSHSYEYALNDSRRVLSMMRGGRGVIVWHDYGTEWEGVTRALDELVAEPAFRGLRTIAGTTLALLELG
jgi:predicted O-methyltransferase YrrM